MTGYRALLPLARLRWRNYAVAFLALALGTGLFLLIPQKLGQLIQTVSRPHGVSVAVLLHPALSVAAILIGQAVLIAIYSYMVALASEQIGNELRARFFRQLLAQPIAAAGDRPLGEIASEFASDLTIIQAGLSETLVAFARHGIFTLGAVFAMFFVDWRMAAVSLGSVVVVAGVITLFIHFATRAMMRVQHHRSRTVALLLEAAHNAYVIKAYDRIDYFNSLFRVRLENTYREIASNLRIMTLINPVSLVVFAIAIFIILAYGVTAVADGRMTVADLVAFITYAMVLVSSVSQLGVSAGKLKQAAVMYTKHEALLTAIPPVASAKPTSLDIAGIAPPEFRFDDLTYTYPGAKKPALCNVCCTIAAGRTTIVVGESGAGKSTFAGLLVGLLEAQSGGIRISGEAGRIAVVPQNPFLFAGTIADNIAFGREEIDREMIEAAARCAQIDMHIRSLPDGYDQVVQEGGKNFSRGQLQRLALARAFVGRPSAIVMDEATASLDVVSERAIRASLAELRGTVTLVIIAHQGDMLSDADHVVVLSEGRVLYEGEPGGGGRENPLIESLPQLRAPCTHAERAA